MIHITAGLFWSVWITVGMISVGFFIFSFGKLTAKDIPLWIMYGCIGGALWPLVALGCWISTWNWDKVIWERK